jgi:DNA-binding response OmpR family regulator
LIESTLQLDGVSLDAENDQVTGPGGTYHLTPMECRLLEVLMLHPGQVVSRASLMKYVWQTSYVDDTRTLEVHICTLRKKIESDPGDPKYLRTVRGVGYVFVTE